MAKIEQAVWPSGHTDYVWFFLIGIGIQTVCLSTMQI